MINVFCKEKKPSNRGEKGQVTGLGIEKEELVGLL